MKVQLSKRLMKTVYNVPETAQLVNYKSKWERGNKKKNNKNKLTKHFSVVLICKELYIMKYGKISKLSGFIFKFMFVIYTGRT